MISPAIQQQLHERLEHLPPGQQRQVLDFAIALAAARPRGGAGRDLLPLAGTISVADLAAIAGAVADCERVDPLGW